MASNLSLVDLVKLKVHTLGDLWSYSEIVGVVNDDYTIRSNTQYLFICICIHLLCSFAYVYICFYGRALPKIRMSLMHEIVAQIHPAVRIRTNCFSLGFLILLHSSQLTGELYTCQPKLTVDSANWLKKYVCVAATINTPNM